MTKTSPAAKPSPKSATLAAARKRSVAANPKSAPAKTRPAAKPVVTKPKNAASAMNGATKKPAVKSGKTPAKAKPVPEQKIKKPKLVRDSFTMPEAEYRVLGEVKKACIKAGFEVKKSELLRVGVALIHKMDLATLKGVLASLPPLKAGRPKKDK